MFASQGDWYVELAKSKGNKSGGKGSSKKPGGKKSGSKKAKETKRSPFLSATLGVLITVVVLLVLYGGYELWIFAGRPGIPGQQISDRTECVELWFYNASIAYLVPVSRNVTLARGDSLTVKAVGEWATGPDDTMLARVYPANIPVPVVRTSGRTAVIDLPAEIQSHLTGSTRTDHFFDALTLTVEAAGECSEVRITIGGEQIEATGDGYILNEPFKPPVHLNEVVNSGLESDFEWATVYFLDQTGSYLIPLSLQFESGLSLPEQAVSAILESPPREAVEGPMRVCPPGYGLEQLTIENGTAAANITVPNPQTAFMGPDITLFRRALYLTLHGCCGIEDVEVLLNGRNAESYARFGAFESLSDWDCINVEVNRENAAVN
ncbi:MAG TPA: GerMN domain-containing protein [bacterium]